MDRGRQPHPAGRRQSLSAAQALAGERVRHVYTSTLARAVQTAEIVAASLDIGVTTRMGCASSTPATSPSARTTSTRCWPCTTAGSAATSTRGCQTGSRPRSWSARLRTVLEEIAAGHPGETVLVVSHGGTLRIGLPALCRMDVEPAELENTATVEVRAEAGERVCVRWGS